MDLDDEDHDEGFGSEHELSENEEEEEEDEDEDYEGDKDVSDVSDAFSEPGAKLNVFLAAVVAKCIKTRGCID